MKISAIQLDVNRAIQEGPENYVESMILEAAKEKLDAILLPEKWNAFGPFETHEKQADINGDRTRRLLSSLAKQTSCYIIGGSVIEKREGKLYNTAHVFDRRGDEICRYDKVHLYKAGEKNYYSAGNDIGLFQLDGISCGVAICYDMDFPEWIRCYALQGVDIIFAGFAWPSDYMHHLEMVQKSRALENQCYVVSAGLCKSDDEGNYRSGGSSIVSPTAEFIAKKDATPGIITAEIKKEPLMEARRWQNFIGDRRGDLYRKYGF